MQLFNTKQIKRYQHELSNWKVDAYQSFVSKISNKAEKFPCIPATQGLGLDQFRYGFVSKPGSFQASQDVAWLLKEYSESYKAIGRYTSLIIFFENTNTSPKSIKGYEELFWNTLEQVSNLDDIEWPREIPKDANHPLWEFCFHGERYFVYVATPMHRDRKSRKFSYFMFAITPRKVFDQFQEKTEAGPIKTKIRERLSDYDLVPPHPELKPYGKQDNFEAKQYFLRDDQSTFSKCPFHRD